MMGSVWEEEETLNTQEPIQSRHIIIVSSHNAGKSWSSTVLLPLG